MSVLPNVNISTKIDLDYRNELKNFLDKYCDPAFGTLTKKEIDLLVFEMMINLNILSKHMYDDQLKLKITNSKIKNMHYELALRKMGIDELDEQVVELLKQPLVSKSGKEFKLEIENPLLKDHIKAKIKDLGHLTDGSFSLDIIKLTDKAYFALIESMIPADKLKRYRKKLIDAGAVDDSIQGLLKHAAKHMLAKYGGDATEALIEKSEEEFKNIINLVFDDESTISLKKFIPNFFMRENRFQVLLDIDI